MGIRYRITERYGTNLATRHIPGPGSAEAVWVAEGLWSGAFDTARAVKAALQGRNFTDVSVEVHEIIETPGRRTEIKIWENGRRTGTGP